MTNLKNFLSHEGVKISQVENELDGIQLNLLLFIGAEKFMIPFL